MPLSKEELQQIFDEAAKSYSPNTAYSYKENYIAGYIASVIAELERVKVSVPITHSQSDSPFEVEHPEEGAAYLTPASPTEQADGGEVNCEIKIEDIDPRVIYNFLIEKGELEYAEHFNLIAKKAYQPPARVQEESEMQRLYDWLVDEQRKPAQTFFTSGELRNVAKEIEFRLSQQYPAEFVEWAAKQTDYVFDGEDWHLPGSACLLTNELYTEWKRIKEQGE